MKPRQVPIFLYSRVENIQFWINSIGHLGWLSCVLNFPRFHKNVNSLELWKYISENSSPKGSFWRNERKSEFSSLSADSRYLLAVALNRFESCYIASSKKHISRFFLFFNEDLEDLYKDMNGCHSYICNFNNCKKKSASTGFELNPWPLWRLVQYTTNWAIIEPNLKNQVCGIVSFRARFFNCYFFLFSSMVSHVELKTSIHTV